MLGTRDREGEDGRRGARGVALPGGNKWMARGVFGRCDRECEMGWDVSGGGEGEGEARGKDRAGPGRAAAGTHGMKNSLSLREL